MNGKQLKEWAAKVPDDAVLELKARYTHDWTAMELGSVRAVLVMNNVDSHPFAPVEK